MNWIILIAIFILGTLVGRYFVLKKINAQRAGSLIIDLRDPYNDQPFLLELSANVNDVYNMDFIILDVSHK